MTNLLLEDTPSSLQSTINFPGQICLEIIVLSVSVFKLELAKVPRSLELARRVRVSDREFFFLNAAVIVKTTQHTQ